MELRAVDQSTRLLLKLNLRSRCLFKDKLLPKEFIASFEEKGKKKTENEETRSATWDGPNLSDDAWAEKLE